MNPRKLSRVIASGMLMALLALPVPAQAATIRTPGPAGVWEWMVQVWQRGVSAVVPGHGVERKQGPGFDPNGLRTTGQGGDQRKEGPGFDPNGLRTTGQDGEGQGGDPNAGEGAVADPRG
jgi:hypothetical protein